MSAPTETATPRCVARTKGGKRCSRSRAIEQRCAQHYRVLVRKTREYLARRDAAQP